MVKKQDSCILLFVKYPDKGKVKLRLSANLNEDIVQDLYRCFVQDTLTTIKKIDAQLLICFFPFDAQKKFQDWLGSNLFIAQNGADLGERMKNSFTTAFKKGYQRAILMGSDSPDLPQEYLKQAFSILKTHDVVLGPAIDGGYYLIGFQNKTFYPSIFKDISWGTHTVLQETLSKIKKTHYTIGFLPTWSDIDTLIDLKNLIIRANNTSFKSSQTMTYLHKHLIQVENND